MSATDDLVVVFSVYPVGSGSFAKYFFSHCRDTYRVSGNEMYRLATYAAEHEHDPQRRAALFREEWSKNSWWRDIPRGG